MRLAGSGLHVMKWTSVRDFSHSFSLQCHEIEGSALKTQKTTILFDKKPTYHETVPLILSVYDYAPPLCFSGVAILGTTRPAVS